MDAKTAASVTVKIRDTLRVAKQKEDTAAKLTARARQLMLELTTSVSTMPVSWDRYTALRDEIAKLTQEGRNLNQEAQDMRRALYDDPDVQALLAELNFLMQVTHARPVQFANGVVVALTPGSGLDFDGLILRRE